MQHRSDDSTTEPSHDDRADIEPPPKRRRRGHGVEGLLAREVGLMRDGAGGIPTTFVGSASGIHFIRSVYGAISSPAAGKTSPEANLVPGEDDQLVGAAKPIWTDQEVRDDNDEKLSFDALVGWSASYFDAWHPAFPFLHAPTVLDSFETIAQGGLTKLPAWDVTIVKTVISISAADRRQTGRPSQPVPRPLVFTTFDDSLHNVQAALTRPATMTALQAVICVQLFLVSMLRLNAASRLSGLIVQMAYQLGLHRCPMRYQAFTAEERQLRKRIWWSIYCIERYVCQALGFPLMIQDADADVCHLNKELHKSETPKCLSTATTTQKHHDLSEVKDERLQLLVFLAQHAQLRGSIMELRNKRLEQRDKNPETAVYINAKLMQWWNEVEDLLDPADTDESAISSLHRTVLESLKHESVIMLNRPLLALPKNTANYASAIHACIAAAKSLLSTLSSLLPRPGVNANEVYCVPMTWPSFTWAAWMSAFIILHATAEGMVSAHIASRNVDKALKVLEQLALRQSVWPQACAVAIEDLRSILTQRQADVGTQSPSTGTIAQTPRVSQTTGNSPHLRNWQRPEETTPERLTHSSHPVAAKNSRTERVAENVRPVPTYPYTGYATSTQPGLPRFSAKHTSPGAHIHDHRSAGPSLGRDGPNDGMHLFSHSLSSDNSWPDPSFFPQDIPSSIFDNSDPFQGFDIPFWVGSDNTLAWMNNM